MSWYLYVEGRKDRDGVLPTYWYGDENLTKGMKAAIQDSKERLNLQAIRIESVLWDDECDQPDESMTTEQERLWIFPDIPCWKWRHDDPDFMFPIGVVPINIEGNKYDRDEIRPGYILIPGHDVNGVKIVLDQRQFFDAFKTLFTAIPARDTLEIRIGGHWNAGTTEVWIAPPDIHDETLYKFLLSNTDRPLNNGHIEIGIYCREAKTTLRVTDHKTVAYFSDDKKYLDIIPTIEDMRIQHLDTAYSIDEGIHHCHYCWDEDLTVEQFKHFLTRHSFKKVDEWKEDA
jgi:hypothetical protein